MPTKQNRVGVWLIGAKGGVAATAITGLVALQKGLAQPVGLVSELPAFRDLGLVDWADLVVGGHDIREISLVDAAQKMHSVSRAIDADLLKACQSELEAIDSRIRSGTVIGSGEAIERLAEDSVNSNKESPRAAVRRLQADLREFAEAESLCDVIVVNVASTEPPLDETDLPTTWAEMEKLLDGASESSVASSESDAKASDGNANAFSLPASSLYAIAALDLGYSHINFTPSVGSNLPALDDLARLRGAGHCGRDGKTGETLLKSVLAPMFAHRNLEVMSWVGHNIFGNMDGKILDDPRNKQTKVTSKDRLLTEILGYDPQTLVSIEYIESLGDWKTAWDHIHFRGFLGTPMTMQFTWQGCDSLLAAPLVLDLIRFTQRANRNGMSGTLDFLSCFFKSPMGSDHHAFEQQFEQLVAWADAANSSS